MKIIWTKWNVLAWCSAAAHKYEFASCVVDRSIDRCMNMSISSSTVAVAVVFLIRSWAVAYVCAYILINLCMCVLDSCIFFFSRLFVCCRCHFVCVVSDTACRIWCIRHNWIVFEWQVENDTCFPCIAAALDVNIPYMRSQMKSSNWSERERNTENSVSLVFFLLWFNENFHWVLQFECFQIN